MKILKQITVLTLAITFSVATFGQKHKGDKKAYKEKVQAMKIGYITEKLDLTAKEAQQFWPIYNEFDAKMDELRKSIRKSQKKGTAIDEMTDAEIEKMIENTNNMRQQELNTQKEYHNKFKAVISIKKVAKLYKAEHGFKKELLKKLRVKKGGPNELNIPPPPPQGKHVKN